MALHESVLEEFGLAPRWVRRGMTATPEAADEPGAEQGADAPRPHGASDLTRLDAREPSSVGLTPQTSHTPAMRAAEPSRQADNEQMQTPTQTRIGNDAPGLETQRSQPGAPLNDPQQAEPAARAEQSSRRSDQSANGAEATQQRAPRAAESRNPASASAEPHMPESPSFDAPPADDFAWFDDLPLHPPGDVGAPMHALGDTPQPPAIHTLDWDALSERVSTCERCRLCEKRTRTVFGVGDRNADWMLIGEAPGENEDRVGEPFVGQAGKLLDNMLRSLTLARDANVYIANVIKCRPPGNRNPEPDEVARCEPYLQRQVGLVKPKLIVALGRFAAQSLLKTDASISSLRGRVHEYEGVPVIVTYHPAYLLRSLPDKAKAWADLCLARDTWRAAGGAASNAAKQ
ncbi:uracil-DNA glycosylase family protein [Paraburkholderia strydomiana]|uniref:uracil-DNA glycosylase family protein n=1 Tax=Paraburkholderia strydomiana TaxID=1245417 RepID=UPI0038B81C13